MDVAAAGAGGALLFTGEPGIGKSRLVDAAVAGAADAGMAVARARADELETRRPFRAIANALGVGPDTADPLRRPVADLLARGPTTADAVDVVDAVIGLVDDLCDRAPMALALDDLQWADDGTLLVLQHLVRRTPDRPLLIVGACRPTPQPAGLARLARDLTSAGHPPRAVDPLVAAEVDDLLRSILGVDPGPRLRRQAEGAGGNPFYVTELVAALRSSGSLVDRGADVDVDTAGSPVARALTTILELSFLTPGTQDLLRAASVLGSTFSVRELALATGEPVAALAPRLREAMATGLLREEGEQLAFRHDLIREALYDDLPVSMRQGLHLDVADALLGAGASALDVAEHVVRGASPGNAVALERLRQAADEATVRAPAIAIDLLQRAVDLFDPTDGGRDELRMDLAIALETAGRADEAAAIAAELLQRRQPPLLEAKARFAVARQLGGEGRVDDGVRAAALAAAVVDLPPRQRVRIVSAASSLPLNGALDLARSEAAALEAPRLEREHPDEMARASATYTLAVIDFLRGRFGSAAERAAQARVGGEPAPDVRMAAGWRHHAEAAHLLLGQALHAVDRVDEATQALRGVRRAATVGFGDLAVASQSLTVSHGWMLGAWDDAATEFDALADLCTELDRRAPMVAVAAGGRALIALHRGEGPAVHDALGFAVGSERPHTAHLVGLARALLAEADAGPAAALEILVAAWQLATSAGVVSACQHLAADLVRLARAEGDDAWAADAGAVMDAMASANPGAVTLHGIALRCHGLRTDDPDRLVEAAEVLRVSPRPLVRAYAAEDAGDALGRASDGDGDRAAARAWFDEALAGYAELHAVWDAARAAARMRALGMRRGTREARARPKTGWAALTNGERAVVDLVADGLSNPEVAARLYLSRHTVKRHLANAMQKLAISSRRELRDLRRSPG